MDRGTKKGKVTIVGYYNHHNFGDELVLNGLRSLFKDWIVIPMNYETINFDIINKCDLFVLGGGELINAKSLFINTPSVGGVRIPLFVHRVMNRAKVFNNISWVHHIKVPKVILGCGVNAENIDEIDERVIGELEQFEYIGLRDNASVEMLESVPSLSDKVHLFYDASFAVPLDLSSALRLKNTAIVIPTDRIVGGDRGIQQTNMAAKSKDWLTEKLKPFDKVIFLAFGEEDNDDYLTCKYLSQCHANSKIILQQYCSFEYVVKLISSCRMVFPYRLHGLLLAFMLGKQYEFYPYHWKVKRVHETIKDFLPRDIHFIQQREFEYCMENLKCKNDRLNVIGDQNLV